jgi:HD-GYP domain-containing protein (c-di-GMP phosphodiesterase class II)/CheY-like chemotaxis protein
MTIGQKILVVESDLKTGELIKTQLNHLGYENVEWTSNGKTALELIETFHPSLALVDIFLEGEVGGVEIAELLKLHYSTAIVFLMPTDNANLLNKAQAVNPFGYLFKPVQKPILEAVIQNAIRKLQLEERLVERETSYKVIFEDSPISLWQEDFSEATASLLKLRARCNGDFRQYLCDHPVEAAACLAKVKVLDVNKKTLHMFHAEKKEDLFNNLDRVFGTELTTQMVDELVAIADGQVFYEGETQNWDLDGNKIDVMIHWSVPVEYHQNMTNVIVSIIDISSSNRRRRSLEAISEVSTALRIADKYVEMLPIILDQLEKQIGVHSSAIILNKHPEGSIFIELARGHWAEATGKFLPPGEGVNAKVLESRKPVLCDELENDSLFKLANFTGKEKYTAVFPLLTRDQTIGTFWIGRNHHFSPGEISLLSSIANISAIAIYRSTLNEKTRVYADQMASISSIGRALAKTFDLDEIYSHLANSVRELMPEINGVLISTFEPDENTITCAYAISKNQVLEAASIPQVQLIQPGEGAHHEVIQTRQPLVINDFGDKVEKSCEFAIRGNGQKTESAIFLPLLAKGEILGVLQAQSSIRNRFTQEDIDLLTYLTNTGAISIKNARLFTETEERLSRLTALHAIDLAVSSSLDLRVTLNILLDQVITLLNSDAAIILLFNSTTQELEFSASRGFRSSNIDHSSVRLGMDIAGQAALTNNVIPISSLNDNTLGLRGSNLLEGEDFIEYTAIPLLAKGQVKGVLEIFHREHRKADVEWIEFFETLAGQAAIAIDNNVLFNQLQRSNLELTLAYDSTLEGWARALDLRDKETEGHSRRVTDTSVRLGRLLGLNDYELVQVRRGALLHDIGKMAIPDKILLKPGPLTAEEWNVMMMHPYYAYEMLSPIPFLSLALDIPYCHHEKWDGTGYPRQMKGEQIPFSARIFAIVDIWDSLLSNRPYRPAWKVEKVKEYILSESGKHLDPQVVQAFTQLDDWINPIL